MKINKKTYEVPFSPVSRPPVVATLLLPEPVDLTEIVNCLVSEVKRRENNVDKISIGKHEVLVVWVDQR